MHRYTEPASPFNAFETPVRIQQDGATTLKYYNFVLYAQRNTKDEITGIGIIATEVTSQALMNNQVKESERRYRELSLSLEEKVRERTAELHANNIELQKTNKELESFAYVSSHDLQEPLRKIQTFASIILNKEAGLSDNGKEYFRKIQTATGRMRTLVNDLLAYSRTTTTEHTFEPAPLEAIVEAVRRDMQEELTEKQAVVDVIESCEVNVILFQFRQLMMNPTSNALKFARPSIAPHIRIQGRRHTGRHLAHPKLVPHKTYCHIQFSDNGIGFEQRYSEQIFELFQRLHGKTEYEGTGIGLSIVKKIIGNHAGHITATSQPGQGATFDIYLPAD